MHPTVGFSLYIDSAQLFRNEKLFRDYCSISSFQLISFYSDSIMKHSLFSYGGNKLSGVKQRLFKRRLVRMTGLFNHPTRHNYQSLCDPPYQDLALFSLLIFD